MVLGISQKPVYTATFAVCVVAAPLCILATVLRFIATLRSSRKIGREDWFALGALVILLAYIAASFVVLNTVNGRNLLMLSPDQLLYIGKISYSTAPFFVVNQFFAKFSILFFYYRLFWVNRILVYWIYIIGAVHIAYCLATLPIYLFSCRPISKGWNALQPGTCINYAASVAGAETVNSAVDFAMVILALFMVQQLQMKKSIKWKLGALFALGSLAGIIGFVKIGEAYKNDDDGHFVLGIWSIVQMACSIICCCAPTYRKVLPGEGFFARLASQVTSYGSLSKLPKSLRSKASRSFDLDRGVGASKSSKDTTRSQSSFHFDGSSQRGFAWTTVNADSNQASTKEPAYPMKTVSVQQEVDNLRV